MNAGDSADHSAMLLDLAAAAGLSAVPRSGDPDLWEQTASRLPYLPVAFSAAMIDYQLAYWNGNGVPTADVSLVLLHDRRPCGLWPLSIASLPEGYRLGSSGGPVTPPLFAANLSPRSAGTITACCLDVAHRLADRLDVDGWQSAESFCGQTGIGEWQNRSLRSGARVILQHELYSDLEPDLTAIKATFRKSYKALVSSGTRLWQVGVLAGEGKPVWEEFRRLHLAVSGKATRSLESWELQYRAVVRGDAFLVTLRDAANKLVGGGFFHVTRDEGLYAVGAYDRDLFDKPLGHVVQFRAIEEMKLRGVRWYKLGLRPYPGDQPAPTEKELRIADFKQGFASHLFPRFVIDHPARSRTASQPIDSTEVCT